MKIGPIKLNWPTSLVIVAGIAGVVCVLILAPSHVWEASSGLGGLLIGALLDRLAVRAPKRVES